MMRHVAPVVPLAFLAAMACSNPAESCSGTNGMSGQWSYHAVRESPQAATISGTLVVSSATCSDFQGALDVVESLATGEQRRLTGPVYGTVDGELVRFDASVTGGSREHFARLAGDSLAGSWVESSGTIPGSGEFGGHRQAR